MQLAFSPQTINQFVSSLFYNDNPKTFQLKPKEFKNIELQTFLIIGATSGLSEDLVLQLLKLKPALVIIVDTHEEALIKLSQRVRLSVDSKLKYRFRYELIDYDSPLFERILEQHDPFDYVINLSGYDNFQSDRDFASINHIFEFNYERLERLLKLLSHVPPKCFIHLSSIEAVKPSNFIGVFQYMAEHLIKKYSSHFQSKILRLPYVLFSNWGAHYGLIDAIKNQRIVERPVNVNRIYIEKGLLIDLLTSFVVYPDFDGHFTINHKHCKVLSTQTIYEQLILFLKYETILLNDVISDKEIENLYKMNSIPLIERDIDIKGLKSRTELYSNKEMAMVSDNINFIKIYIYELELDQIVFELKEAFKNPYSKKHDLIALVQYFIPEFRYLDNGVYFDYI